MPHLICKQCDAPYMGIFVEHIKPICQVCNSEEFLEVDLQTFAETAPAEDEEE